MAEDKPGGQHTPNTVMTTAGSLPSLTQDHEDRVCGKEDPGRLQEAVVKAGSSWEIFQGHLEKDVPLLFRGTYANRHLEKGHAHHSITSNFSVALLLKDKVLIS